MLPKEIVFGTSNQAQYVRDYISWLTWEFLSIPLEEPMGVERGIWASLLMDAWILKKEVPVIKSKQTTQRVVNAWPVTTAEIIFSQNVNNG